MSEQLSVEDVLGSEQIVKKNSYKHGTIYLTRNHLVWEDNEKVGNCCVVPLVLIHDVKEASKSGVGLGLRVLFGKSADQVVFFPFVNKGFPPKPRIEDIKDWKISLELERENLLPISFSNVEYFGHGYHQDLPEKHKGRLTITKTKLVFTERKGVSLMEMGDFEVEIPLHSIFHAAIHSKEYIDKKMVALVGLWAVVFPTTQKLLVIEHKDKFDVKQTTAFDFLKDADDKKKVKATRIIQENIKKPDKEEKISHSPKSNTENPLNILKIRFAKGEISKEEYLDMKKILEE